MDSFQGPKQKEEDYNWEKITSGSNKSSWYANLEEPIKFDKLNKDIPSSYLEEPLDVIIIGGEV